MLAFWCLSLLFAVCLLVLYLDLFTLFGFLFLCVGCCFAWFVLMLWLLFCCEFNFWVLWVVMLALILFGAFRLLILLFTFMVWVCCCCFLCFLMFAFFVLIYGGELVFGWLLLLGLVNGLTYCLLFV